LRVKKGKYWNMLLPYSSFTANIIHEYALLPVLVIRFFFFERGLKRSNFTAMNVCGLIDVGVLA